MFPAPSTIALLSALAFGARAQDDASAQEPFPSSTALAEAVSPEGLAKLGSLVQNLVDDEEIVGAELLVIRHGRSVLHEAYGWKDREAKAPMKKGSLFCVRSMTKPVIGAAILMLIEEGRLAFDDPVSKYLPAFDVEGSRDITVEHLLTHASGLPLSLIIAKDLRELGNIRAVADLGGGHALEAAPGSAFLYSDQGTDTLTALIEVVTGAPADVFVRERLLEPLGMRESACVLAEDHPLRERALPKYAGSRAAWSRFWSPDDPPLFPFFLGSQGLYATLEDYARFLDFWKRKGRVGKERLLGSRFVRKALTPGSHPSRLPTGFPGMQGAYGCLMQLWTGPAAADEDGRAGAREVVVFGHSGSDGTHAWVFPEQDAMVLYFTQSRNNTTGLRVEEALGELFLGVPYDPNQAAPPFDSYLGYYWEGEGDLYRAIIRDGEDLALEIIGKGVVPLTYAGEDRWKFRPNPGVVLAFDRSEEGQVTGYHIGEHQEFRFEPSDELPSLDEIVARVRAAHRIDLLESLGPVRVKSSLTIEAQGVTGEVSTWLAWPDRWREDGVAKDQFEHTAYDGQRVWYASKAKPKAQLEGPRAEALRLQSPFIRFGDWRRWYPRCQVIQRLEEDGREIFLVRTGDTSAPARTMYVEGETGLVRAEGGTTFLEGLGRIGQQLVFDDFRDVSGMKWPFRTRVRLANSMIGTVVTIVEEIELGVEVGEGTFELGD